MTTRHTAAWAVVASLTAHVALLGWLPVSTGSPPTALPPEPPRPLHAVLLPPPAVPAPSAPPERPSTPNLRPSPSARVPAITHRSEAAAVVQSPVVDPRPVNPASTGTPVAVEPPPSPPADRPLDLNLPAHARGVGRQGGPTVRWRSTETAGPIAPEWTAAEKAAAAPLAPGGPAVTGTVSVREQRGGTLSQAEVRTPWSRYCMRKRQSSRMTELHDSPFGQGMQATNCDRD